MENATMKNLPQPVLTKHALCHLASREAELDRAHRAFLSTVDGQRNVVELESVAKAMGLPERTLGELRERGWLKWEAVDELTT